MRRRAPFVLIGIALVALLGWYLITMRRVAEELRRETAISGRMFARVYAALGDTTEGAHTTALLDLSRHVVEMGVPVIVTDSSGRIVASANVPDDLGRDSTALRAYLRRIDFYNPPVGERPGGLVHFGRTPIEGEARWLPLLQTTLLTLLLLVAGYGLSTRYRADREQVWAGMAREAAHQLGTPLSSMSGWIEVLLERAPDPEILSALAHMSGDLERLERVAHRFERIGRPPKSAPVDVGQVVRRLVAYFSARVPTLAMAVRVRGDTPGAPLIVQGDEVLIEWAIESLMKNAIDALAGRGGDVTVTAQRDERDPTSVRVRVADNGPGVPRELRRQIFQPGFSTKQKGWGIGLSLARRIVEEGHKGRLLLAPTDQGAAFDVILSS